MRILKVFTVFSFFCLVSQLAFAQYPDMGEVQPTVDSLNRVWNKMDAEAWEKALPVILNDMQNDKPYNQWAQRADDLPQADIPAFPGAEGGGMYTVGGRGGKVFVVTNLADSGPGTLREACDAGGARIVVFNVAGIIKLERPININAPYITIAGQTAPGDGVCIAGESFLINTHDVIIRHMRFRRGDTWVGRRDDAIGGNPVGNIIIDHISASWGLDENMTLYRHMFTDAPNNPKAGRHKYSLVNITIQNSIFAEGLDTYNHAFGSTLGGQNCMFVRNVWTNNTGRNPSVGMNGTFNFVNNVVNNWWHRTMDGGDYSTRYQLINNYYKPGPITPKDKPVGHRFVKPESRYELGGVKIYGKVWVDGNIMEGYPEITSNNWKGIQIEGMDGAGEYLPQIKSGKPFKMPYVSIMEAQEAHDFVLENAGANLPKRDAVDKRLLKQVKTNKINLDDYTEIDSLYQFKHRRLGPDSWKKGIITDIRQVGGYPEYKGQPYKDSDKDGMPDKWENKYKKLGLDPNDPTDATEDCNGDGYTNIEKYINGIDPSKKIDWTNLENNYDTLSKKGEL
ncbi:pectate lyase [uncultured Draconibacterium sp.]|uniref:pectate lyase family protein n=1 Tax=uncultured Draconibacterium sp. TaxID=1573823 RepID=UPI0025F6F7EC|nr:pectate lyase [uncultured Draconibacterium sp.]